VFFDLGLSSEAFKTAHDQVLAALRQMADGSAKSVVLTEALLPQGVPQPLGELVGHILADNFAATRPGPDGRWSATIDMYKLRHPILTLEDLLKRPERRRWTNLLEVGSAAAASPKPTLWAFIASTLLDLTEHRQAALEAALRLKILPLGMELRTASPTPPLRDCLDELAEADFMILIAGCRYGSLAKGGKSYTEAEYDDAQKRKIPIYVFLPVESYAWPKNMLERDHPRRLERFLNRLRSEQTVAWYDSVDDLRSKIIHAVSKARAHADRAPLKM
jgi:hypothetical protein